MQWGKVGGVGDHGGVLVRPDRFVAWNCEGRSSQRAEIGIGHEECVGFVKMQNDVLAYWRHKTWMM